MKPEEFDKALAAGKIAPLYFIYGEEGYLVEACDLCRGLG